jgi:hypothetical protein
MLYPLVANEKMGCLAMLDRYPSPSQRTILLEMLAGPREVRGP